MKPLFSRLTWLVIFGVVACQLAASQIAFAQINLGTAGPQNYGVLNLSGQFFINGAGGSVVGNVGIPATSYNLQGTNSVTGTIFLGTGVTGSMSGSSVVTGGFVTDNAKVTQAATDAKNFSAMYAALPPTLTTPGNAITSTRTITGVAGQNVLSVTSVNLSGGATLTINAPAGSTVIINDTGGWSFNMSNIALTGGITTGDVLFNVLGGNVTFVGPGTQNGGILLCVNGTFTRSLGVWFGEVIANSVTITSGGSVNNNVPPPAGTISGTTLCATCDCPIAGITVQLLNSMGNVVATTTSSIDGTFSFANQPSGTYSISIPGTTDYETVTTSQFMFNSAVSIDVGTIDITANPIKYLSHQGSTLGQVWFGTAAFWQSLGYHLGATTLTEADLSTPTFVSTNTVYPYADVIPDYPELGAFTGNIYVLVSQPLVDPTAYHSASFTNLVGLAGVWPMTGGGTLGTAGEFTLRELFNQPFTGPGTAHHYIVTNLSFMTPHPAPPFSLTALPPVWLGGGPAPPLPPAGDVPTNWMAQTLVQWTLPPATSYMFYANGTYQDVCGDPFTFSICPKGATPHRQAHHHHKELARGSFYCKDDPLSFVLPADTAFCRDLKADRYVERR